MHSADRTPSRTPFRTPRTLHRPIPLLLPALLAAALGAGGCSVDSGPGTPGNSGGSEQVKNNTTTVDPVPAAFLEAMRQETKCMREHGITDYPDPSPATGEFQYPAELGKRLKQDPSTAAIWQTCQAKSGGDGIQGG
ncbi:hypothetical protein [Streptomyces sp. RKAG293]|uniref:hypothetical protein n=1 Tax=Streptomyces sp. RKAG293 TaxID=2893403 RepID=UPI002033ABC4|nr:hypothetical protein [Streptomyces sp. RKAG293]MCM2420951.1 hypothetical protein [Streptomyces sp. RKAG293]